jgi:hypothetical protein
MVWNGREVFVLKGYDEVAVFLGLDVGKEGHHAVAQDRSGKKLLDRALPKTRPSSAISTGE